MDTIDVEEDNERILTRSNSWSHTQRPVFLNASQSIGRPIRDNGLSCIYEMDDNSTSNQGQEFLIDGPRNRSKSISCGNVVPAQIKKRRHSYTELIASAILSSPEKRKTLAEIYDWFVLNVPSFKDQRYMHSSLGWKNAVRHNLSVQTCFKRVKRHGMEKPSWWTVDLGEVAKRRLVLRPTINSGDGESEFAGPFLPPRRNTYSGPTQTAAAAQSDDAASKNRTACRVASTNDLLSTSLPNSNIKRSHYAPIRPATQPGFCGSSTMYNLGNGQSVSMPSEPAFHEQPGLITKEDNLFFKPCAMESSQSNFGTNGSRVNPSVTLVCKESTAPDHGFRQAQLEVSVLQAGECGSFVPTTTSPNVYNWSYASTGGNVCHMKNPETDQTGVTMSNHFRAWPNASNLATQEIRPCAPNQTLRVKTVWGNVQDISFNGLLPMRTVVKCDGTTQTEEAAANNRCNVNSAETISMTNKQDGFGMMQWDLTSPVGYDLCSDPFGRDYSRCTTTFESELPDDLAGLQIEGDIQCDIDEVLGASFDTIQKSSSWSWNLPLEQSSFGNGIDTAMSVAQSPFSCGKIEVSEP